MSPQGPTTPCENADCSYKPRMGHFVLPDCTKAPSSSLVLTGSPSVLASSSLAPTQQPTYHACQAMSCVGNETTEQRTMANATDASSGAIALLRLSVQTLMMMAPIAGWLRLFLWYARGSEDRDKRDKTC
ncbi:expressed unknown protein [Seminavis robusta]|uniref:Uncharacterized protein n=1 Tax=Seminavis robusta TaxID=568900 RepID=A0A9N8DCL0_9STRA|nr:expressed unknown protein [Seminavis robusta]|eukprot:Sro35_g022320.1 n/a (130) ;mRNA; f:70404-70793